MIWGISSLALSQFLPHADGESPVAKGRGSWELNCRCDLSKLPSNIQRGVVTTVLNEHIYYERIFAGKHYLACTRSITWITTETDLPSSHSKPQSDDLLFFWEEWVHFLANRYEDLTSTLQYFPHTHTLSTLSRACQEDTWFYKAFGSTLFSSLSSSSP